MNKFGSMTISLFSAGIFLGTACQKQQNQSNLHGNAETNDNSSPEQLELEQRRQKLVRQIPELSDVPLDSQIKPHHFDFNQEFETAASVIEHSLGEEIYINTTHGDRLESLVLLKIESEMDPVFFNLLFHVSEPFRYYTGSVEILDPQNLLGDTNKVFVFNEKWVALAERVQREVMTE